MRAVVLTEAGENPVQVVQEIDKPTPGDGEVLIRNRASGVNFIDTIITHEGLPAGMIELPFVNGVEGAGEIMEVGPSVIGLSKGDKVLWTGFLGAGGYGEYSVINQSYVAKLSNKVDLINAGGIAVNFMTAHHMLFNLGQAQQGDTVLLHAAAGGVGSAVLQLANRYGIKIIASVSEKKVQHALDAGAIAAVDYRQDDVAEKVMQITDGKGVQLTLNPISGATILNDLKALAPFGQVIVFGFIGGSPNGDLTAFEEHFSKSIAVRASDLFTYLLNDAAAFKRDLEAIAHLYEIGEINPVIYGRIPFNEAPRAHEMLKSGEVVGKLVLTFPD